MRKSMPLEASVSKKKKKITLTQLHVPVRVVDAMKPLNGGDNHTLAVLQVKVKQVSRFVPQVNTQHAFAVLVKDAAKTH
jgi:hypothetical protein